MSRHHISGTTELFSVPVCCSFIITHQWNLSQSCFSMTVLLCIKWRRHSLPILDWKNLSVLHRALTSTPTEHFLEELKCDCILGLLTHPQYQTSLKLFRLNEHKTPQPCAKKSHKKKRVALIITANGEPKLKLDVQQAPNCDWSGVHLLLAI